MYDYDRDIPAEITVNLNVNIVCPGLSGKLDKILSLLAASAAVEKTMSKELDDLQAQVTANSSAVDSAVALINGIADRIAAAGVDPAKLQALTDELRAKDTALSAAVLANTPPTP